MEASVAEQAKARPEHLVGDLAVEKVRDLLKHFRSAMFTTLRNGELRTRPMGLMGKAHEFAGALWFFTDDRSHKIGELDGHVSLILQSDGDNAYVHLRGSASVSRDRAIMDKLYTPLLKTWFPDGLEDPHVALVRFEAETGEFWESPGGLLQVIAAFTKSVVTGKPGAGGNTGALEI